MEEEGEEEEVEAEEGEKCEMIDKEDIITNKEDMITNKEDTKRVEEKDHRLIEVVIEDTLLLKEECLMNKDIKIEVVTSKGEQQIQKSIALNNIMKDHNDLLNRGKITKQKVLPNLM